MFSNTSKIFNQYDKVFRILHQDHSFFLERPNELIHQKTLVNVLDTPRILNKFTSPHKWPKKRNVFSYKEKIAALKIQNFLCSIRDKRIYRRIKYVLIEFTRQNPTSLLKKFDYTSYTLFEKDNNVIVFR